MVINIPNWNVFMLQPKSSRICLVCICSISEISGTTWWIHYISCLNCYTAHAHTLCTWMVMLRVNVQSSCEMATFRVAQDHVTLSSLSFQKLLGDSFKGLRDHISAGILRHLKVAGLHAAFCSWQGRFLFITTQFCGVARKLHLFPYCGLVDMTLLSCYTMTSFQVEKQ